MVMVSPPSAEQVLRTVGVARRQERGARNLKLAMAAGWADCHPPESIDPSELRLPGRDRAIRPGGEGTPALAAFCLAEFAVELGISRGGAEAMIADALDLRHRLPRLWARVSANEIEGWQAQQIARQTRHLSVEQAGLVDVAVAGYVGRAAWAQVLRLVAGKIIEVDAERVARLAAEAATRTGVWVDDSDDHGHKTAYIRAGAAAVIWFDAMVSRLAEILKSRGDEQSADERRPAAIGIIANPLHAVRLLAEDVNPTLFDDDDAEGFVGDPGPDGDQGDDLFPGGDRRSEGDGGRGVDGEHGSDVDDQSVSGAAEDAGRESVVRFPRLDNDLDCARAAVAAIGRLDPAKLGPDAKLYVHIAAESLQDGLGVTRVEDVGPVISSLVGEWLQDCHVKVQPVIDLNVESTPVDGYEVPRAMRERMFLKRPTSVFPYSASSGRRLDLDHCDPYRVGGVGQTRESNLGPLGRRDHNDVTHGRWRRRQPEPGTYLFRAPHGRVLLVNASGTTDLGHDHFARLIWQACAPAPES